MAQQLTALAALPETVAQFQAPTWLLTTIYNFSARDPVLLPAMHTIQHGVQTYTQAKRS